MHLLLCVVAFVQQSSLDEDVAKAIDKLYSDRHTESEQGKAELVEIGRKAVGAVVAELNGQRLTNATNKDKAPRIKRQLCEILGDIRDGGAGAVDALIARLEDKDEFGFSVASAAADSLAKIGDEKAAPALLKALNSKQAEGDAWLKYYCIRGLGLFRHAEATDALKKLLNDKTAATIGDEKVHLLRVAAADALGRLRANAGDEIGKLLSEQDQNPYTQKTVAWHAARALERILKTTKGALEGDENSVKETLAAWTKWYDTEVTKRNIEKTAAKIKEVTAVLEKFKTDQGDYPDIIAYLHSKPPTAKTWPEGGYIKKDELQDAWGRDLVYRKAGQAGATPGEKYDLLSWGKDGRQWGRGDDADIWNHTTWRAVKADETKKAVDAVVAAVAKFKEVAGRLPRSLGELKDRPADVADDKWKNGGPFIKEMPKDGYGNFIRYACPGQGGADYDLFSYGADDRRGGLDECADLWNHDKWKEAAVKKTKERLDTILKAVEKFKTEQGRFPEKLDDLKNKPSYAKNWRIAYTPEPFNDEFGNDLVYTLTDAEKGPLEIKSLGADGKAGGTGADEDLVVKK